MFTGWRWRTFLVPALVLGGGTLGIACPPRPGPEPTVVPAKGPMTDSTAPSAGGAPIDNAPRPAQLADGGVPGQNPGPLGSPTSPDPNDGPAPLPGPQPPPPPPGVPVDRPPTP